MIVLLQCAVDEETERLVRSFIFDAADLLWYVDPLELMAVEVVKEDICRTLLTSSNSSTKTETSPSPQPLH